MQFQIFIFLGSEPNDEFILFLYLPLKSLYILKRFLLFNCNLKTNNRKNLKF